MFCDVVSQYDLTLHFILSFRVPRRSNYQIDLIAPTPPATSSVYLHLYAKHGENGFLLIKV